MRLLSFRTLAASGAALLLTACGGGGGGGGGTPLPSVSGTAAALSVKPASLSIVGVGASSAATFAATETGYSGSFTESDTCSGLATVTSTTTSGPSVTYTVTPSSGGSCTVTIHDASGQHTPVSVSITGSSFTIEEHGKHDAH